MTTKTEQEMREAFAKDYPLYQWKSIGLQLTPESYFKGYQAATASAEGKYLPVIEKLVVALNNPHLWLSDGIKEQALALAAPLLKGEK